MYGIRDEIEKDIAVHPGVGAWGGDHIVGMNTVWQGMEKGEPDFSVVPADRTGGNGYTLKTR